MAAAPNNDLKDTTKIGQVETNPESVLVQEGQVVEIDNAYLQSSWTSKFWRSVLFQMILFGWYVSTPHVIKKSRLTMT